MQPLAPSQPSLAVPDSSPAAWMHHVSWLVPWLPPVNGQVALPPLAVHWLFEQLPEPTLPQEQEQEPNDPAKQEQEQGG